MNDRDEMLAKIAERNKLAAATEDCLVVMPLKDRDVLLRVARAANVVSELALVQVSGVRADACVVLRKCLKELPEGLLDDQ